MRNVPHGLRYLNTRSPDGGAVWGGDAALLEEVCNLGRY